MSLKDCYAKLGKVVSKEDQDQIDAISETLIGQGVSKKKAETQAVGTVLSQVESNLESIALRAKNEGAKVRTRQPKSDKKRTFTFNQELSTEDQAIERRAFRYIEENYDLAVEEYNNHPETEGGKVLSSDIAKELFDEYNNDRTKAPAVHNPASVFIKRRYQEVLKQKPTRGQDPVVMFTAGGAGAGKTTAINDVIDTKDTQNIYDGNFSKVPSAIKKIDSALANNKAVHIVYVHRDVIDALENGAFSRAMEQEQKFGSGRVLRLSDFIRTHVGARDTLLEMAERYKDDERVMIDVINNSQGFGNAKHAKVDMLRDIDYNEVASDAFEALEVAYEAGQISEAIYEGFKAESETANSEDGQVFKQTDQEAELDKYNKAKEAVPELAEVEPYLTLREKQEIRSPISAKNILDMMDTYPSPKEISEIAKSGRAKRGWYNNSKRALDHVFGEDAPRFTALLSALSPQTSVESNLENALSIWVAWDKAGRPTSEKAIVKIMEENVQQQAPDQQRLINEGKADKSSVLYAWVNNSVKALQAKDFDGFWLSGAKVDSFMKNLWGDMYQVTNDAWMGNYANINQEVFAGKAKPIGSYVGISVNIRKASEELGWSPAEVQETVWSWAKALYEMTEAGDVTAEQALKSGRLTHEMINDVPDFSVVMREKKYAEILKKGGYGSRVRTLKGIKPQFENKDTGSVYDKGNRWQLKSARRLDELRARRNWENARNQIQINLSSAVTMKPEEGKALTNLGLRKLAEDANNGDEQAVTLLHEIAIDSLNDLLPVNNKKIDIRFDKVRGLYFNALEPSVEVTSVQSNKDLPKVLKGLAQFGQTFAQDAVYVRGEAEPNTDIGYVYDDGSYNTTVVRYELEEGVSRESLEQIAEDTGLAGFTIGDGYLDTWYVGDPNDQQDIEAFENGTEQAEKLLEGNVRKITDSTQRFWSYGQQADGAYYTAKYDDIAGTISKSQEDRPSKSAQRIATHLAGYEVEPAEIPDKITPEQRALQQEIAVAYENMLLDNMVNPQVKEAYERLADEVLEQFDSLPVAVESWEERTSAETKKLEAKSTKPIAVGQTSDPYGVLVKDKKGKNVKTKDGKKNLRVPNSKNMRKDILYNNHIWIYKTNKDTFGEEGVIYEDHPMLRDSGRTDANGVPLMYNDLLRAVHDYYAHSMSTANFIEIGEEVAWKNHMKMTKDPLARWALTTETRGQNSWVNFREGVEDLPRRERRFADQKADLLPVKYAMFGDDTLDSQLADATQDYKKFNQPSETKGVELGEIEFTERETIIRLFETSNLSTFLHEAGHLFLELEYTLALRRGDLNDDQRAILKWLDVGSFEEITEYHHEKWARGFERYLREGKSPSFRLMDAFANYSNWLKSIYRDSSDLNVSLPDSIRNVMNRMLASDKEIEEVTFENANNELFKDYESAGMTEKEWQSLQKQKQRAEDKAKQSLTDQLLEPLEREYKKQYNEDLRVQTVVEKEKLMEQPIYQAMVHFRKPAEENFTNKINPETIKDLTDDGKIPPKMLSMVSTEASMSVDDAGQMYGFEDGAKFIDAVQTTPKLMETARANAKEVIAQEQGDPMKDGTLRALAEETARNEETAKYLLTELRILNRKIKKKPVIDSKEFKYRAMKLVAGTPVYQLTPHRFRRLEVKYAKEAQKHHSEGNIEKSIEAKKKQIANFYLYRESLEAKRKAGVIRRRMSTMQKKKYNPKHVNTDYQQKLKLFLSAYNFKANGKPMAMEKLIELANWVQTQHNANIKRGVDIKLHLLDPKLQEISEATTPEQKMSIQLNNYKEMTISELQGVDAMAQHMLFVAKRISDAELESSKRKYEQIGDSILENAKRGTPFKDTFWVRSKKNVREYASTTFMNAHNMTRLLDGWTDGLVTESIKKPIDDANTEKLLPMQKEIGDKMTEIYDKHFTRKELKQYGRSKIAVEGFDDSFSKWEIISVALNMGTESNKQAMLDGLNKTDELQFPNGMVDINNILDKMSEKDWKFVQDIWGHINSYWDRVSAYEQQRTGFSPTKIEGIPVNTKYGTIQGAYYPLAYDGNKARKVAENDAMEVADAQRYGRFYNAKVKAGFTEERVGSGGLPVRLDVNVYHQHMNKIAHFLSMGEAVNEVQNVIASEPFRNALRDTDNNEMLASLDAWIKDVATGEIVSSDIIDRSLRRIRTGFSTLAIGWNIGTAMLQPLGLTQSYVVLGQKYTNLGLYKYMKNPKKQTQTIQAMSKFMHERAGNFNKDIYDRLNDVNRSPHKPAWLPDGLSKSFFTPIVWTQRMVDGVTWTGAFEKSRAEKPDKPETYHVWVADRAVARSQASGVFADRTGIERGTTGSVKQSEWVRMFTALGSYFFNKANLLQEATSSTDFGKPREIVSYVNKLMALVVWETIAYHMMKGTIPDWEEKEELPAFILEQSAYTMLGAFPLVREFSSEAMGFRGGGTLGTFYKTVGDGFKQAKQGEADKALIRSINDIGGIMFRYPSKAVFRVGDELVKDVQGDDFDPIAYLMWREKD